MLYLNKTEGNTMGQWRLTMINKKEITNPDAYKIATSSEQGICRIPLFHGTRRFALTTTSEERHHFYSACRTVMEFAKKLSRSDVAEREDVVNYRHTSNPYFLATVVYLFDTNKFKYGGFYVTSSYSAAISFSYNVGGELGEQAYSQCKGFRDLDFELDAPIKNAAAIVEKEYGKYCESEKVILVYNGVRFSDLTHEGGSPFIVPAEDGINSDINKHKINRLHSSLDTDMVKTNQNFTISNFENYTADVLSEKDFKEGFSLFTNIKEVDEAIKKHNSYSYPKWNF